MHVSLIELIWLMSVVHIVTGQENIIKMRISRLLLILGLGRNEKEVNT